jgi:predicted DNA-binding transcriptional regulator YafY
VHDKRTVELLVKDERQALERVMMQFSIYQKAAERIEENSYRITLTYEAEDEIDLMIRILSFGTSLKVVGPESFVEQIKNRLEMQKRCGY